jgi:NifU-like protein involved in Fe-S cluster formation
MNKFPYSETVLEHFRHPRNVGRIDDPDGKSMEGSPACGDMVAVYIKVDKTTQRLTDIKFESYGCASNIATGSIITEMAKGKTLEEAKKITWKEAADALGGLPALKAHCSVLAIEGLRAAIRDYEERQGLVEQREATTEETLKSRLKHVMNPLRGLDLIRTNLVKELEFKDGVVRIVVDLPSDHQFANTIREDVEQKILPLWDVKQVKVEFTD